MKHHEEINILDYLLIFHFWVFVHEQKPGIAYVQYSMILLSDWLHFKNNAITGLVLTDATEMDKILNIYCNKNLLMLKCLIVVLLQAYQNGCLGIQ
jgi:hypothetical protein